MTQEIVWEYISMWDYWKRYATGGGRFWMKEELERTIKLCVEQIANPAYAPKHERAETPRRGILALFGTRPGSSLQEVIATLSPAEAKAKMAEAQQRLDYFNADAEQTAISHIRGRLVPVKNGSPDPQPCERCHRNKAAMRQLSAQQWFYSLADEIFGIGGGYHGRYCQSCHDETYKSWSDYHDSL